MDERIDILDEDGNFIGKTAMKSEAHRHGWFHPTVHVWCYSAKGNILLQQRAKSKTTFPLLWDVSVAGHIGTGENIRTSALREMEEEIGLCMPSESLEKIGIFKSTQRHSDVLIDNEFHHTFLCKLTVGMEDLEKQHSEVAALRFIPIQELKKGLGVPESAKQFVPHLPAYYNTILKAIEQRL